MTQHLPDDIAKALLKDRRSDRLWRNIRFFVWLAITLAVVAAAICGIGDSDTEAIEKTRDRHYVSLVRLDGEIMAERPFSTAHAIPALRKAFADQQSKGVILLINSPGGSATQASIIHDQIVALKKQYHKKLVVVGVDVLASGAYLVACPADKIYVNRDTVTGSIGVILSGFGFVDTLHKLGITRRAFTSGAEKDTLDPFKELTPPDKEKIQSIIAEVHQNFITDVRAGRGKRLLAPPTVLFSGAFWTGKMAVKLGLVDGTGDYWSVMKREFNVSRAKDYTEHAPLVDTFFKTIGTSLRAALSTSGSTLELKAK